MPQGIVDDRFHPIPPPSVSEPRTIGADWRARNHLAAGMIYLRDKQPGCRAYAFAHGVDLPDVNGWTWPS